MRILHVLDHSVPLHSGYAFRTLSILREQRALGWETFHLTSPKHYSACTDEEEVDGWHFYRTCAAAGGVMRVPAARELALMTQTTRRLHQIAARLRPHIIHAHSPVLNALPALVVGKRLGIPVVYEVRALWEDAAVDHGANREWGLRYRLTRYLETYALKRAGHVITICEGLRGDILARGVSGLHVSIVPNAVDTTSFSFGAGRDYQLGQALGLEGCTVVGFIGSFYAYEGLDLLLDALPHLLARQPRLRLLLVGGGPQEPALKAQAARLGISEHVRFIGRVPHGDVARYYSVIDVLAYPRRSMRLTELVTPLKPLEAMAQGHLFVASNVGGHRELVRDGQTGVLFEAGNAQALAEAIERLLSGTHDCEGLRQLGRRFVEEERTWRKSVARYVPIYEGLRMTAAA